MLANFSKNDNENKLPLQFSGCDSNIFDSASSKSVEELLNLLLIKCGLFEQNKKVITNNLDGDARTAYQYYTDCKPDTIYIGHSVNNSDLWLFKNCFYIMFRAIDYPYAVRVEYATDGEGVTEYGEDGKTYKYPWSMTQPYTVMRDEITNLVGVCKYHGHTVTCNFTLDCSGISSQENLIGFPDLSQKVAPVEGGTLINKTTGTVIPLLTSNTSGYITIWNNIEIPSGSYILNFNLTLN